MKSVILSLALLLSVTANADENPSAKEQMVDRVESIIKEVKEMRDLFDDGEIKKGCDKSQAVMEAYKLHLMDSGVKLDREKSRSKKVVNWAYEQLIYFHKLTVVCGLGEAQEYVHPDEVTDELKSVLKSLRKQRRKINRDDVESRNSFKYDYHFEVHPTKNN